MRIISPFRDYYDSFQLYDQDRDTVFLRKTQEIEASIYCGTNYFRDYDLYYVGFCGKIYPRLASRSTAEIKTVIYDIEKMRDLAPLKHNSYIGIKRWIVEKLYITNEYMKLFDKYHYFVTKLPDQYGWRSQSKVTIYPKLSQLDFGKVFPAYQCYQELLMWIGNKAVPIKPIPQIDDKTMAGAKGFDKFSFRKDKKND